MSGNVHRWDVRRRHVRDDAERSAGPCGASLVVRSALERFRGVLRILAALPEPASQRGERLEQCPLNAGGWAGELHLLVVLAQDDGHMLNRSGRPLLLVLPSLASPKKVSKNISVRRAGSMSRRMCASSSPMVHQVWGRPGGTAADSQAEECLMAVDPHPDRALDYPEPLLLVRMDVCGRGVKRRLSRPT